MSKNLHPNSHRNPTLGAGRSSIAKHARLNPILCRNPTGGPLGALSKHASCLLPHNIALPTRQPNYKKKSKPVPQKQGHQVAMLHRRRSLGCCIAVRSCGIQALAQAKCIHREPLVSIFPRETSAKLQTNRRKIQTSRIINWTKKDNENDTVSHKTKPSHRSAVPSNFVCCRVLQPHPMSGNKYPAEPRMIQS